MYSEARHSWNTFGRGEILEGRQASKNFTRNFIFELNQELYPCGWQRQKQESIVWAALGAAERVASPSEVGSEAVGPRAALCKLKQNKFNVSQSKDWLEAARIESVLGSCRQNLPSVRSG